MLSSHRVTFMLILAGAALSGIGCDRTALISWLPDSSGFVFTEDDGRSLIHFDIKNQTRKTIVKDSDTRTLKPAVSPDSKQIALVRIVAEKDKPARLQVLLYGFDGKRIRRS